MAKPTDSLAYEISPDYTQDIDRPLDFAQQTSQLSIAEPTALPTIRDPADIEADRVSSQTRMTDAISGKNSEFFNTMGKGVDHAYTTMPDWFKQSFTSPEGQHKATQRQFNTEAMSHLTGKTYEEVNENYDQYAQHFSTNVLGLSDKVDDTRLYNGINKWRGDIVTEERQREVFSQSLYAAALPHVAAGGTSGELILDVIPGIPSESLDKGQVRRQALQVYGNISKRMAPHRREATALLEVIKQRQKGKAEADVFVNPLAPKFKKSGEQEKTNEQKIEETLQYVSGLSPELQDDFIFTVDKLAEVKGVDIEGLKSSLMVALSSGADIINQELGEVAETAFEKAKTAVNTGEVFSPVIIYKTLMGQELESAQGLTELNPRRAAFRDLKSRVRDWQRIVSRLDTDTLPLMPAEWEESMYVGVEAIPRMAMTAVPTYGTALAIATYLPDAERDYLRAAPELKGQTRFTMSMFSAILQGSLDKIGNKAIFGGIPIVTRAFKHLGVRGAMTTAVGAIGKGFATELVTEHAQEASNVFVQEVAHQIDPNIPQASRARMEAAISWKPEIFRVTLMMSFLGGGGRVAVDRIGMSQSKSFLEDSDQMEVAGLSPEISGEIAKIAKREGVFKARKRLELEFEKITPQELEVNREASKGKADKMVREEIKKTGTPLQKAHIEAVEAQEDYMKRHEATIQEDEGQFKVVYPESQNKPSQFFDTESEAQAVVQATRIDAAEQFDQELSQSVENIDMMRKLVKHQTKEHNGSETFLEEDIDQAEDFARKSQKNMDQMLGRMTALLNKAGHDRIATVKDFKAFRIQGQNALKLLARGSVSRIAKGANVSTVIEETSEGFIKDLAFRDESSPIKNLIDKNWVKGEIIQFQENSGRNISGSETVESMTDEQAIEAFSDLAMANFWNKKDSDQLPKGLSDMIDMLRRFFHSVLEIAGDLLKLKAAGKLSPDFQLLIDQAIGINMDEQVSRIKREATQEIAEDLGVDPDITHQVTLEQDTEYMAAVESGDMGKAQAMVDAAAKAAGYDSPKVYHGTKGKFDKFIPSRGGEWGSGVYFAPRKETAEMFGSFQRGDGEVNIVSAYLKLNNPLETNDRNEPRGKGVKALKKKGFDGVIGTQPNGEQQYVVFEPNQAKSADPITKDASGKVIPLSERFDPTDERITHQLEVDQDADPLMARIQALAAKPEARLMIAERMAKRLDVERNKVRDQKGKVDPVESIGKLQAIVSALPVELRGKIGGWKTIADLRTEKAVEKYLIGRIDKIDKVLETYLRKEYAKKIKDLVKKGQPKKGKTDKVAKGHITPEGHDEMKAIDKVIRMTPKEVEAEGDRIQKIIEDTSNENYEDVILGAESDLARLITFANLTSAKNPMPAEGAANALAIVEDVFFGGKAEYAVTLAEKKEKRDSLKEMTLKVVTGGAGKPTRAQRKDKAEGRQSRLTAAFRKIQSSNISFEHLLNWVSRLDNSRAMESGLNKDFGVRVHQATHGEARAVAAKKLQLENTIATIWGVNTDKMGWNNKVIRIMGENSNRSNSTGIFISEEISRETISISREVAEEIDAGLSDKVNDGVVDSQLSESEIQQIKDYLKQHPKAKNIKFVREERSEATEQRLSQDEALFLTMMYRQEGLQPAMESHGYDAEVMEQMEKFIDSKNKAYREWLFEQYDNNHAYFNETFREMFGLNLPKVKNYSPAKSYHRGKQAQEMIDSDKTRQSTTPGMAMERIQHKAEPRDDVGATSAYINHIESTEHFVHWAGVVGDMRSVFMNKDVRESIEYHHGREAYKEITDRVEMFAAGGAVNAQKIAWLDSLRKNFTVAKLAYNWGVMIKQLTSLPAYMYDMDIADYVKYQTEFMLNPVKNLKFMWNLDYTKNRFHTGYDRDVNLVLNQMKPENIGSRIATGGMKFGQAGDIIPVMIGGYSAYRNAYEKAKAGDPTLTEEQLQAKGILAFEMATDRAQQSGHLKDQSAFSLGGSLARVLTMFTTSPRQYYANVSGAAIDAFSGREGGKTRLAKHLFISHVVLPSMFYWVSVGTRNAFKDDDEKDQTEDMLNGWYASMLLGPLSGLGIVGQGLSEVSTGYSYNMAVLESAGQFRDAFVGTYKMAVSDEPISPNDVLETLDEILGGIALIKGGEMLLYDISKNVASSVGFTDDDVERMMMDDVEGNVHDLGKKWNQAREEFPSNKEDKADRSHLESRYDKLAEEYMQIKRKYPQLWEEIAEELQEKGKLPRNLRARID